MSKIIKYNVFILLINLIILTSSCLYANDVDDLDLDFDNTSSSSSYTEIPDPIEPFNRGVFYTYKFLYNWAGGKTILTLYNAVPIKGRKLLTNFTNNIHEPVNVANYLMQLKFKSSIKSMIRFVFNSTFGLLGFFDVMAMADNSYQNTDLGSTLAFYGVGEGFYVFLYGPSNFRDTVSYMVGTNIYAKTNWMKELQVIGFDHIPFSITYSGIITVGNTGVLYLNNFTYLEDSLDEYSMIKYIFTNLRREDLKSQKLVD